MQPATQATVEQATYYINAEFADNSERTGTGFCILPTGVIVTCAHVVSRMLDDTVEEAHTIDVDITVNGVTTNHTATIVKNGNPVGPLVPANMDDPDDLDLAVLQLDAELERELDLPTIAFSEAVPAVDSVAVAFGAFYTEDEEVEYRVEAGTVSGVFANGNGISCLIRHDCAIDEGFSGGPLTDDAGAVIGVDVLADPESPRRYAIAAAIVQAFVSDADVPWEERV